MNSKNESNRTLLWMERIVSVLLVGVSIFFILTVTVLNRPAALLPDFEFQPFWSYVEAIHGDTEIRDQIFLNIALFVPFGFFTGWLIWLLKANKEKHYGRIILGVSLSGCLLSCMVELAQLVFYLGLFEFDDIFNNTIGTVIGVCFCALICHLLDGSPKLASSHGFHIARMLIGSLCAAVFLGGSIFYGQTIKLKNYENYDPVEDFAFQVDDLRMEDGQLAMEGYCFIYGKDAAKTKGYSLCLKSCASGKCIPMEVTAGLECPDVQEYFECEFDYTNSGFTAVMDMADLQKESADYETADGQLPEAFDESQVKESDCYEVVVHFPWAGERSTGFYISGEWVYRVKPWEIPNDLMITALGTSEEVTEEEPEENEVAEENVLASIIQSGEMVFMEPTCGFYVFQCGNQLYWVADASRYPFKADGRTQIEYMLWTTQIENLPEKRLENEWYFDNIYTIFEDHEVTDDECGKYRVAVSEIPEEYAVKYIVTGYYENGAWVWRGEFRVRYE